MVKKKKKRAIPDPPIDVKGRLGGLARARSLSAARRKQIAKDAANARWGTNNK